MTDAISRSALMRSLEEAEQRALHDGEWPYTASVLAKAIVKVKEFVAELPALDVAPVVHARWIMNHFGAKCSNCLRLYCIEPSWSEKIKHMPPTWIYCPNCGARMDGEAE